MKPIKQVLLDDFGITLRKCPIYATKRRLVRDEINIVIGCCGSFDAMAVANDETKRTCTCGHGPDMDKYE